jgi:hypothetical protein
MKNSPAVKTSILLPLILAIAGASCDNMDHRKEKPMRVILPAGEVRDGWYFAAGDQVVIEGTVNGDAYVAGGIVEVNGTINGDLLVAGGQVTVGGKVSDDIRAAGGSLRFDGKVGKNIAAAGGSITFGKTAETGGNVLAAGGSIQFGGKVAGNAKIAAGDFSVTGNVGKDVDFAGENLSILEGARINGNLNVRMRDTTLAEIAAGTVRGSVNFAEAEWRPHRRILGFRPFHFWFKIFWMFSLLAAGLVAILVFPRQFNKVGANILESPGMSLLWGIVALIGVPIAVVILCLTVIGIPLALWAGAIFLWLAYLSQLSFGVVLGQRMFRLKQSGWWGMFWKFAVGLLIVQVLTFVPYLRTLVIVVGLVFGLGAIAMVIKEEVQGVRRV